MFLKNLINKFKSNYHPGSLLCSAERHDMSIFKKAINSKKGPTLEEKNLALIAAIEAIEARVDFYPKNFFEKKIDRLFNKKKTRYIKKLIKIGADPNFQNGLQENALKVTCNIKNENALEVFKILFKNGADPNLKNLFGNTSFSYFCEIPAITRIKDFEKIFNLFIEHGADPNIKTRFHRATLANVCLAKEIKLAKKLIKNGAEINPNCEPKNTPLHQAGKETIHIYSIYREPETSLKLIQMLLDNGANPDKMLREEWYPECLKLLDNFILKKMNQESDQEFNL